MAGLICGVVFYLSAQGATADISPNFLEQAPQQSAGLLVAQVAGPNLIIQPAANISAANSSTPYRGVLTTLSVDNIQVRSDWEIVGGHVNFTLSVVNGGVALWAISGAENGFTPPQTITLTVQVSDKFSILNTNYVDLSVQATMTIIIISSAMATVYPPLALDAPPRLTVFYGDMGAFITLTTDSGVGQKTYNLTASIGGEYFGIDSANGVLSVQGMPTVGIYTLAVEVEDGANAKATIMATVAVEYAPLALDAPPRLTVFYGDMGAFITLATDSGAGQKTYNLTASIGGEYFGIGPANGVLSVQGMPTVGIYTLAVEVEDEANAKATIMATVAVEYAPLALTLDAPPRLTVFYGDMGAFITLTTDSGLGQKTYNLTTSSGGEYFGIGPANGVLSVQGLPTVGIYTLAVDVRDEANAKATIMATVVVEYAPLALDAPSRLTVLYGYMGAFITLATYSGMGQKTYNLTTSSGGEYFGIDSANGVLSVQGLPTVGIYTLAVEVEDAANAKATIMATVAVEYVPLALDAVSRLTVFYGDMGAFITLATDSGVGQKTYNLTASSGGEYFGIDSANGVLSVQGMPTVGIYTLAVDAEDEANIKATIMATVVVEYAPLALDALPRLTVFYGDMGSFITLTTDSGVGQKTYNLTASIGGEYFVIDSANGVLSVQGMPSVGIYTLAVEVEDGANAKATIMATVTVEHAPLALDAPPRLTVFYGDMGAFITLTTDSGVGQKTYNLTASSGGGYFGIGPANGVLSVQGLPTVGIYTLAVEVEDEANVKATIMATVAVEYVPLALDAPPELLATVVAASLHTFVARGGDLTYTYAIISGNDMGYFALGDDGGLTLTATTTQSRGRYTLNVSAMDGRGEAVTVAVSVRVEVPIYPSFVGHSASGEEGHTITVGIVLSEEVPAGETFITTLRVTGDVDIADYEIAEVLGEVSCEGKSCELTIPAGQTGMEINITLKEDGQEESDESLILSLDGAKETFVIEIFGVCDRTPPVCYEIARRVNKDFVDYAEITKEDISKISHMNVSWDGVTSFKDGDFAGLNNLETLYLTDNTLTTLPEGIFSDLSNLENLYLYNNTLTTLPEGVFSGLSNLEILRLDYNSLTTLPAGIFSDLSSLKRLEFSYNALTTLPEGVFSGLSSLEVLGLDNNKLPTLPAGIFSGLSSLEQLWLYRNALSTLPAGVFSGLSSLEWLSLDHNDLTTLPEGIFSDLSSLEQLLLNHNPVSSTDPCTIYYSGKAECVPIFRPNPR